MIRRSFDRIRSILDRLGLREAAALLTVLLATAGIWAFIEIADEVHEGETHAIDHRLLRALRRPDNPAHTIGPAWLEDAGRDVTALGSWPVLGLAILATVGYLLLERKRRALCLVLGAVLTGQAVSLLLKGVFARDRPDVVPHLTGVASSSFPSGHAMMSAVVYLTLGALLARLVTRTRTKMYILAVALLLTLLVGLSRVLLGVHYPSDVLAGWTAGLVWALLCSLVASWLQRRGAVESAE